MDAEIVDLDALVPSDVEFQYRGETYRIPGDVKSQTLLNLYALLVELEKSVENPTPAKVQKLSDATEAALLPLFQILQPEMEELPFGSQSLGIVVRTVLSKLHFIEVGPPTPAPKPTPRRSVPKKRPARKTGAARKSRKRT